LVRRWVAVTAPYAANAISIVLILVELIERGEVWWAAAAGGAWALAQASGSFWSRRLARHGRMVAVTHIAATVLSLVLVALLSGLAAGRVSAAVGALAATAVGVGPVPA
jgi:hypothetical protein